MDAIPADINNERVCEMKKELLARGVPKLQLHRGKAYFDTWLTTHPDWRGNLSNVVCGNI